jgi:hypothetical protein
VRVAEVSLCEPLALVLFQEIWVSFSSTAPGIGNAELNVSRHAAVPVVCRPGVGSEMYDTPISEVKRGS